MITFAYTEYIFKSLNHHTMANYYKENEFEQWLKNDTVRWSDPTSVSSYKSGVGRMIVWVDSNDKLWKTTGSTKFKGFKWYLQNIDCDKDRDTFFSAVLNIIQKEIKKNPGNKTTLQNYKSYLCAYEDFFRDEAFPVLSLNQSQRKMLRQNSSCATYSKDELINEFQGRVLTQDRISMSKHIMFPIRLITKLWKTDSENWANSICGNIWIIVQDAQSSQIREIQINDIKTLRIEKTGEVKIIDKDKNKYTMCTSYSDPYEYIKIECGQIQYIKKRSLILTCPIPQSGFIIDKNKNIRDSKTNQIIMWHVKPVKIKNIGDIAIDHDVPISQVLIDKKNQLPILLSMSDVYRVLSHNYGLKVSAKEVNKFCKMFDSDVQGKTTLYNQCGNKFPQKEMNLIGKCKLVLMGKDENSKKSDN
jgi:hypothetical protein